MHIYIKPIPPITQTLADNFKGAIIFDTIRLNFMITAYNQKREQTITPSSETLVLLYEIYECYQHIMEKYPQNEFNIYSGFASTFQKKLFEDLQNEFKNHGINSLEPSVLEQEDLKQISAQQVNANYWDPSNIQNLNLAPQLKSFINNMATEDNPQKMYLQLKQSKRIIRLQTSRRDLDPEGLKNFLATARELTCAINSKMAELKGKYPEKINQVLIKPSEFSEYLANMNPDLLSKFTEILLKYASIQSAPQLTHMSLNAELQALLPADQNYQELLSHYSIRYLGGHNTKNFEIRHDATGSSQVLKMENRLGNPKTIINELSAGALTGALTTTFADRLVTYTDPVTKQKATKNVSVSEYCSEGDLDTLAHRYKYDIPATIGLALDLYNQMANILFQLQSANIGFPDAKNQNWLVHSEGDFRVKIDDKKSFERVGAYGIINKTENRKEYYHHIHSRHTMAPETDTDNEFDVDKMHTYILGKNLYLFLTNCPDTYLINKLDKSQLDFDSYPIFSTTEGRNLMGLIQILVSSDPGSRTMTIADVAQTLSEYKNIYDPKNAGQLSQIKNFETQNMAKLKTQCLELADLYYVIATNSTIPKSEFIQNNIDDPAFTYSQLLDTKHQLIRKLISSVAQSKRLIEECDQLAKDLRSKGLLLPLALKPTTVIQFAAEYEIFSSTHDLKQFKTLTYESTQEVIMLANLQTELNAFKSDLRQKLNAVENAHQNPFQLLAITAIQNCLALIKECDSLTQNIKLEGLKLPEQLQSPGIIQFTAEYEKFRTTNDMDNLKKISISDQDGLDEIQIIQDALELFKTDLKQKFSVINLADTHPLQLQLLTLKQECLTMINEIYDTDGRPQLEQQRVKFIQDFITKPIQDNQNNPRRVVISLRGIKERLQKQIADLHNPAIQLSKLKNEVLNVLNTIEPLYPQPDEINKYTIEIKHCENLDDLKKMHKKLNVLYENISVIDQQITQANPEQANKIFQALRKVPLQFLDKIFSKDAKIENTEFKILQSLVNKTDFDKTFKDKIDNTSGTSNSIESESTSLHRK